MLYKIKFSLSKTHNSQNNQLSRNWRSRGKERLWLHLMRYSDICLEKLRIITENLRKEGGNFRCRSSDRGVSRICVRKFAFAETCSAMKWLRTMFLCC
jgi:hypothetical protein